MRVKLPKVLQGKVAGVPKWVWLASIVVMVAVLMYIRYRNKQEELAAEDANEGDPELELGSGLDYTYSGQGVLPVGDTPIAFLPGGGGARGTMGPPAVTSDPINITINAPVDGKGHYQKKCKDGKPKKKAPKGYHWQCVNGRWVAVANVKKPGKGGNTKKCGKRPKKSAGKGYHWECRNGKYQRVKNTPKLAQKGLFSDGPLIASADPPFRRDLHRIDKAPQYRGRKRSLR